MMTMMIIAVQGRDGTAQRSHPHLRQLCLRLERTWASSGLWWLSLWAWWWHLQIFTLLLRKNASSTGNTPAWQSSIFQHPENREILHSDVLIITRQHVRLTRLLSRRGWRSALLQTVPSSSSEKTNIFFKNIKFLQNNHGNYFSVYFPDKW